MAFDISTPYPEAEPLMLLIPGNDDAATGRWLGAWQRRFPDAVTVDLGQWHRPHRNSWVNQINLTVHRTDRPVVAVAHGLACVALAWWVAYERPATGEPVVGALLIDPPDLDRPGRDPRLAAFLSVPRLPLPFPGLVLVSDDRDPREQRTLLRLATDWACTFDTYVSDTVPVLRPSSPIGALARRTTARLP